MNDAPSTATTRRPGRWRRWGLRGLGGLAGLLMVAAGTTAALDARDARRHDAPGELVTLPDGRVLHLQVIEAEHGAPAVILDAGHGGFSPLFAWVTEHLGNRATIVAYDRPGYGWSDPADRPVSAAATAQDLHDALAARGLSGPYVLAGHSLAAHYGRAFADRFPEDTAALVLLDPAHEDQLTRLPDEAVARFEQLETASRWAARLARFGVFRLVNPQTAAVETLPDPARQRFLDVSVTGRYWRAAADEGAAALTELPSEVPQQFPNVPVLVITAPVPDPGQEQVRRVMNELQDELVARAADGRLVVVEGADHLSLVTDERAAAEVAAHLTALLDELHAG
jgi:pimeloyl-ACP methyl ester carboxylesterase